MENKAVKIVAQVGERQFGLGAGEADGADEQTIPALLLGKAMLHHGADG